MDEQSPAVLRLLEIEAVLKDAPRYDKWERAADFCERYMKWFNGDRLAVLLKGPASDG